MYPNLENGECPKIPETQRILLKNTLCYGSFTKEQREARIIHHSNSVSVARKRLLSKYQPNSVGDIHGRKRYFPDMKMKPGGDPTVFTIQVDRKLSELTNTGITVDYDSVKAQQQY